MFWRICSLGLMGCFLMRERSNFKENNRSFLENRREERRGREYMVKYMSRHEPKLSQPEQRGGEIT